MSVATPELVMPRTPERRELPPSMVERMTLILDVFDRRSERLNLEEVAGRTSLPRSTAHRILEQLVRLQWLNHTARGYSLGRRALGLGGQDGAHGEIRQAAAPHLHELHLRTGMVVHLAVLDGAHEMFLDKIGGRYAGVLASKVGGLNPAYRTTGGRSMLAWLPPEEVDTLWGSRLDRPFGHGRWDLSTLHTELNRIRQHNGLSIDRGDRKGVTPSTPFPSVAAAIRTAEGPVAAISVCGEVTMGVLERMAPLVLDAVRRSTRDLFSAAA